MLENRFIPILDRYEELTEALNEPSITRDIDRYRSLLREKAALEDPVSAFHRYKKLLDELSAVKEMLGDREMADMAREELGPLEEETQKAERELMHYLIPRDPDDSRSVIMEIRPGAGGDEASLFGMLLLRMYMRYAEKHGIRFEPVDISETELGGIKEAVFSLSGNSAFARMKYESGVHRIQRVPVTEAGGRIHTSTATVAVLPEAEEVEVSIRPEDLRIDTYRASGHGGQYINRTDSAVRITHLPTGLVVTCQDEKSQLKNKEQAMKVLRSRLYKLYRSEKDAAYSAERRSQVGSGERNERIRTYNFPQGRVTDHRIGLTLYKIDAITDGDLDELINALTIAEETEKLRDLQL